MFHDLCKYCRRFFLRSVWDRNSYQRGSVSQYSWVYGYLSPPPQEKDLHVNKYQDSALRPCKEFLTSLSFSKFVLHLSTFNCQKVDSQKVNCFRELVLTFYSSSSNNFQNRHLHRGYSFWLLNSLSVQSKKFCMNVKQIKG